jgi:hypothetical protein
MNGLVKGVFGVTIKMKCEKLQKELKDVEEAGIIHPVLPASWLLISSRNILSGFNYEYGIFSFHFDGGAKQISPLNWVPEA